MSKIVLVRFGGVAGVLIQYSFISFDYRDPAKDAFVMSVPDVPRDTPVIFVLIYDQLVNKVRGQYQQRINVNPRQVVDNLGVDVQVTEPQRIKDISVAFQGKPVPSSSDVDLSRDLVRESNSRYKFRYMPTPDEQSDFSEKGIDGDVVLTYNLMDAPTGSHTQVNSSLTYIRIDLYRRCIMFFLILMINMQIIYYSIMLNNLLLYRCSELLIHFDKSLAEIRLKLSPHNSNIMAYRQVVPICYGLSKVTY